MRKSILILFLATLFLCIGCKKTDPLRQQYDALVEEQNDLEELLQQVEAKYAMLLDDKAEIAANITVISRELKTTSEENKVFPETNLANYQKAQEDVGILLDKYTAQKAQWVDQLEEVEQKLAMLESTMAESS